MPESSFPGRLATRLAPNPIQDEVLALPLLWAGASVTSCGVKSLTLLEAEGQLGQLIAEACRGELVVLTDGDKQVVLEPRVPLDLEEDTPELEAELLRAVNGPHSPFAEGELRELANKALAEHRARAAHEPGVASLG